MNIRDFITIANLRAISPCNPKAYVDRAIEQSSNEHINKVKTVSANQLKSGGLSIRIAMTSNINTLQQFAKDWTGKLGNGASVKVPMYGILAYNIRTNTMETSKPDEIKDEILQANKPFIPNVDIKYMRWLSRSAQGKFMSSVIIEFTRAEDANRIIDKGLIK